MPSHPTVTPFPPWECEINICDFFVYMWEYDGFFCLYPLITGTWMRRWRQEVLLQLEQDPVPSFRLLQAFRKPSNPHGCCPFDSLHLCLWYHERAFMNDPHDRAFISLIDQTGWTYRYIQREWPRFGDGAFVIRQGNGQTFPKLEGAKWEHSSPPMLIVKRIRVSSVWPVAVFRTPCYDVRWGSRISQNEPCMRLSSSRHHCARTFLVTTCKVWIVSAWNSSSSSSSFSRPIVSISETDGTYIRILTLNH